MAGRKPKPTALKLLQGNPGKRALNDREPQPEVCVPDPPEHLDDAAREHWHEIAHELAEVGILTSIDKDALGLYCAAHSTWVDAYQHIREYGPLVKAPSGYPMQSPFLAIANKAFDQMRALLTEFGMTPSSRVKVKVQQPAASDSMDEYLRSRTKALEEEAG